MTAVHFLFCAFDRIEENTGIYADHFTFLNLSHHSIACFRAPNRPCFLQNNFFLFRSIVERKGVEHSRDSNHSDNFLIHIRVLEKKMQTWPTVHKMDRTCPHLFDRKQDSSVGSDEGDRMRDSIHKFESGWRS